MDNEMNNNEWLEYYRKNPAEFDAFIDGVEKDIVKKEQRIEELELALKKITNFVIDWRDCLDGVQMSTRDFLDDSGIQNARHLLINNRLPGMDNQ
jgi:hypothetical protein